VSRNYFRSDNRPGALRYLLAQTIHICNLEETVRMNDRMLIRERRARLIGPGIVAATLLAACGGYGGSSGYGSQSTPPSTPPAAPNPPPTPTPTPTASAYSLSKLVSDGSVTAATTDAKLVNPWGIVFAPGAPVWVANNRSQTSTLYDGTGLRQARVVNIPAGLNGPADPTGVVANGTTGFVVTHGSAAAPAKFIFDGEGGAISAWAPAVDGQNAFVEYDDGAGGAVYKGLAIAADASNVARLYATDFHNGKVDVFDSAFRKISVSGGFNDSTLPEGYAPFGIQALTVRDQTLIYVTYAKQDTSKRDNVVGAGLGLINVYDTQGVLQSHLVAAGGNLNAPWGLALAPANFGTLSNMLLVGNFGDGAIDAFDPSTGQSHGTLSDASGQPIVNPGLWGIAFGNGAQNQPLTTLYFAAGIASGAGGLYGRIDLGATPPDVVAPTVSITSPAAGATVSGTITISINAADDIGVKGARFFAGTAQIGLASAAPFSIEWDTTTVADGAVALTVQVTDAAGNVGTSAGVTVTVSNATPTVTLSQLQTAIFTPKCSGCHTGLGTSLPGVQNLSAGNTFASIVNVPSIEQPALKRIAPGDPDHSYLVQKIEGAAGISGQRMPFGGPFLSQSDIDLVRAWVAQGALNN
jgi:uncharacterized protein (TIGR03118 family)